MDKTAIFTISKINRRYNVTSKKFNTHNRLNVAESELFQTLEELADVFNNVIGYAILFEIEPSLK